MSESDKQFGRDLAALIDRHGARVREDAERKADERFKRCEQYKARVEEYKAEAIRQRAVKRILRTRVEALEKALHELDDWTKAYPLTVFPEPDLKQAAKVLKAGGLTLDAVSASNMRHVLKRVGEIVSAALRGEGEG